MAKVAGNPQFDGLAPESSREVNPRQRGYTRLKLPKQPSIWIYNVSKEGFRREQGGTGNFYIKPCPDGANHSDPLEIPNPFVEEYALGTGGTRNKIMGEYFDAEEIAENIIKGGMGGENNNLYEQGVFWSINNPPLAEEVEKARKRFHENCTRLVKIADKKYNEGQEKFITLEERRARKELKVNREWDKAVVPQNECPNCQELVAIGAATHSCGAVLDWDKAVRLGLKTPEDRERALGRAKAQPPVAAKQAPVEASTEL